MTESWSGRTISWKVFGEKIFNWWDIRWTPVEAFADFYNLCNNVYFSGVLKSLWLISVSVACWLTWLARNELVFDRKSISMETLIFHSNMRALMWVRAVYDEINLIESS